MARKQVPQNKRAKGAGISLPPELIRNARKTAYQRGMSLSALVRQLLLEHLNEEAA